MLTFPNILRVSLVSLALLATTLHAQPRYTLEDLGQAFGVALNASGEGAGSLPSSASGPQQAVRLQAGSPPQPLGFLVPGGWFSRANALNDDGDVVGSSATDTNGCCARGFLWTAATGMQPLPELPGTSGESEATGINNTGTIVGAALVNNRQRPMVIVGGVASDLGTLGGLEGAALAVNDAGDVVGFSQPAGSTDFHATLWPHTGGVVDLQTLPGRAGVVRAVTQAQQIVGILAGRAFLWTPSTGMTLLALLAGDIASTAQGINAAGRVVGSGSLPGGLQPPLLDLVDADHALLWDQGVPFDLGGLLDTTGWVLSVAQAINDSGQILTLCDLESAAVGVRFPSHTCLLTPVAFSTPPPVDHPGKPRRSDKEKKERLPHEERGR